MTPKEYLITSVLTENQIEYQRYERYVSEYPGMRIETKHEIGALISRIRMAHERHARKDWLNMVSDFGGPFIASCLDVDSQDVADETTSKSLLFAFGGFDTPHEDLVDAISEMAGAVECKLGSMTDSEIKQAISPVTLTLKKHTEILRKTISRFTICGTPENSKLVPDVVVDDDTRKDVDERSWQRWPISDLNAHLAAATFPLSKLIDFQRFFVSFLTDASKHHHTQQETSQRTSSSMPTTSCIVNIAQHGITDNPYAGTGWQIGISKDDSGISEELRYPKGIKMSNGVSRIHEVIFDEDRVFYNEDSNSDDVQKETRHECTFPILPITFPPVVQNMPLRDLESIVEVADDVISALETIGASPWTTPTISKKLEAKLEQERQRQNKLELIASGDYEEMVFRGTRYVEMLKQLHKEKSRKNK